MVFIKKIEDFTCEHCGREVKGGGFTNHCPSCLWSKHVDIDPGDRKETCGGMMEPVSVIATKEPWVIVNKCLKCKKTKKNRLDKDDSMSEFMRIASIASAK